MTVTLQVRDVRAAIYNASGGPQSAGDGAPSTLLLGRIFHEVFAELAGPDPARNFHAAIDEAEPELDEWRRALVKHAYDQLVGPRLRKHQALLHHISDQVLTFWDSVQEMCLWLAEALWRLHERGEDDLSLDSIVRIEQPITWEFREPGWNDSVKLTGIADAVLQIPGSHQWCVIELKTGRTSPEADLSQACLYHQMLIASGEQIDGAGGALALMSFEPQLHERVFSSDELSRARSALLTLIGKIAGVTAQNGSNSSPALINATDHPDHSRLAAQLIDTLKEYGAEVKLDGRIIAGPAFLRFPVALGTRVKLRSVERLAKEIQLRLELDAPPRIGAEAGRVVIDLQRRDRQTLLFSQIREQIPAPDPLTGSSKAPLGVDIAGKLRLMDFAQPEDAHLLVAGTTGSGKSEWLRTAIAGLIVANTPETLQLLIIDPKRNAFPALRNSPFLHRPIVFPDEQPVAEALLNLADEMDMRYQMMSEHGDETIAQFARRTGCRIPRIFCICDEYADLIIGDRKVRQAIEQQIIRLGQKARAAGIHLILATQQPSREIIKGVLDSNIPARVGLKMQKAIESKMLLNASGAETLLGRGDLLFKDVGEPVRLQGAYLTREEAEGIFAEGI